ncbi:protein LATERAL ORGAN BOUNDARIES-like [Impatiens glandulifera]|uniref:protein LATERAL ORGAN BOUNDARIES-like n=1 Tax=Impatiens glandulifera TaxID=253017 RepID=UPI001FB04E09|nr:protein LATERAL ORGAN BOUNDARIES-like [Impatiens glandulifera]
MTSLSQSSYTPACARCKFFKRKCLRECIFAPHFPPEVPQKDAVASSLAYETKVRVMHPVYGCVSAISFLQNQVEMLQKELHAFNAELIRYANNDMHTIPMGGLRREGLIPSILLSSSME